MNLFNLTGRRAFITGASSGLGLHFAKTLAAAGAEVVLAARRSAKLHIAVTALRARGFKAHAVTLDVIDSQSVLAAFNEAERLTGGLMDIIVNNAGLSGESFFLQLAEPEWDTVIDTNLKGAYLVGQEAARRLVENKQAGSIINIASILGLRVAGAVAPYCASKAGLIHLGKAMALELARYHIRVNTLAPGYIETDLNREFFAGAVGQKLVSRIPQRRLGQMTELDGPLLLLASDAGSYMTGSVIEIDGGHLCSTL